MTLDPFSPKKFEHSDKASFEVVFKIQETCNINCKYCYMYNLGNDAFEQMPVQQATRETWLGVADFMVREFKRRDPKYVRLVLHGGEPMLVKARIARGHLDAFWQRLKESVSPDQLQRIEFSLQTNAMLANDEWIELIKDWKMIVGVSIDGPKHINDKARVDKRGRGTFDRVVAGYRRLLDAGIRTESGLGALCVIDPEADGAEVYRYLVDELNFKGFNFLLPFMNWSNYDETAVRNVGRYLTAAFSEWKADVARGKVHDVRIFKEAMAALVRPMSTAPFETLRIDHDVIVVECDGTIMTEESLRPTYTGTFSSLNVAEVSLLDIVEAPQFKQVERDSFALSAECADCALLKSCRSGQALGRVGMRYSEGAEAVRKSVYCDAFIDLFVEVAAFLKTNNVASYLDEVTQLESVG